MVVHLLLVVEHEVVMSW